MTFTVFDLCDLCFSRPDTQNPNVLRRQVRKADLLGKMAAQHILSPNAKFFALQITTRTDQFTSILYRTPEKTLLFPPNRTKLHFIDLSLSPAAERTHFGRRRQAARKPRSLSNCNDLLWQWRLPADKWSISPHVQVLMAYCCSGHMNQFPPGSLVLGFTLPADILGSSHPRCHRLYLEPSRTSCWVLMAKKSFGNHFWSACRTGDRSKLWIFEVCGSALNETPLIPYLPAKWCRPGLGEDVLKPIQLLGGILPPYGWPRPCSLPRGAWIRVTRLSTKLAALPLLFILMTAQMFQQIPQKESWRGNENKPRVLAPSKGMNLWKKTESRRHIFYCAVDILNTSNSLLVQIVPHQYLSVFCLQMEQ